MSYSGHKKNFHRNVIRSDGTGYYEYLPAFIQYNDPWLKNIKERRIHEIEPTIQYNLIRLENGKYLIKYPIGPAILWLPFYLGAHTFSYFHPQYEFSSYSPPYHAAVSVAATFYLISALCLLYNILRKYYSKFVIIFSILGFVFGTNIFHYSTFDACFSHVYSFFAISLWIFSLEKFFVKQDYKSAILMGGAIGLVFLVRNTNIIFSLLFIPYFLTSENINKLFSKIFVAVFVSTIVVAPQFLYYYNAYDHIVLSSYGLRNETFSNFANPKLFYVMFSVNAGFLFWSPIVFLAIFQHVKSSISGSRKLFSITILLIFLIQWLLIASWWSPEFGAGFGHRGFIDLLPIFIFGQAEFYQKIFLKKKPFLSISITILSILLIFYCYALMKGYWNGTIPMNHAELIHVKNTLVRYLHIKESHKSVAIKAANGKYVGTNDIDGTLFTADRNQTDEKELFQIVKFNHKQIAIKAANGKYVCAEGGGGRELIANRNEAAEWELFDVIELKNENIALMANNGQYVTVSNGKIFATGQSIDKWQLFTFITMDEER